MKLNKHKRPYIEPTPAKPSRIVDAQGGIYHPIKAPEGLCKCGVMLDFIARIDDYVFPSRTRADHAREHTIKYMSENNIPVDPSDFILVTS